ncbi:uncharacterized protein BX663DRAFT_251995 [Cokeromyces recurvatus]|uniref:uncharacterized protein n=1 Tax=Cokeromyces recurvatus TaxID=90255 RepID=UPI0022204731|nr:uncharacterized protein BX663DRAFT_251995 [Cokeromyces recurvatus]KAI7906103.1 hypothetical protein BX663DRAFT_251995 [Cokeromyces recurvatus]
MINKISLSDKNIDLTAAYMNIILIITYTIFFCFLSILRIFFCFAFAFALIEMEGSTHIVSNYYRWGSVFFLYSVVYVCVYV